jgi:hypothetical protein
MQHPALQRQDVARHPCAQLSPGLAGSWGWRTAMADSVADGDDRRRAAAPHEDSHSAEMLLTHLRNQVGLSRTLCGTRLDARNYRTASVHLALRIRAACVLRCIAASLPRCTCAPLHRCTAASLQRYNPTLHRSLMLIASLHCCVVASRASGASVASVASQRYFIVAPLLCCIGCIGCIAALLRVT